MLKLRIFREPLFRVTGYYFFLNGITQSCGSIGNSVGYNIRFVYRTYIQKGFFRKEPITDVLTIWWIGYYGFITPLWGISD